MIRTATVSTVTSHGVWIKSAWLAAPTGPIPAVGDPQAGDLVVVVGTDDGDLVAIG